jgi:mRNA interferase HigB
MMPPAASGRVLPDICIGGRSKSSAALLPIEVRACYSSHGGNFAVMQIIAKRTLREFWAAHPQAEVPLRKWHSLVEKLIWTGPEDVKRMFGTTVDFVGDNRIVFDIGGNKYRLVVHVAYRFHRVLIKFVGTHAQYDRIDVEMI